METAHTPRVECPLTTNQLVDVIIRFVQLYNESAQKIQLYDFQRLFMRRIVESLLIRDGNIITGLWSRQCLAKDTVILDRDGSACQIQHHPRAWKTDDSRPVYKVKAQNGFAVRATANHPFFTQRGWVKLEDLTSEDELCILDHWEHFERGFYEHEEQVFVNMYRTDTYQDTFFLDESKGRLLGYLTSDGYHAVGQSIKFTNTNRTYLQEAEDLVKQVFPCVEPKRYEKGKAFDILLVDRRGRGTKTNEFQRWMHSLAWDEGFPTRIFSAPKGAIKGFINRLFSGDGCASRGLFLACGNSSVYAHYCQLLLARFGVDSRVKREWMVKSTRPFFRLCIDDKPSMKRFLEEFGPIFGKEEACASLDTELRRWSRRTYREAPQGEDGETRVFSRIVSVEPDGEDEVWDVSYPGKGWFFAHGITVHNSGKSESISSLSGALAVFLPTIAKAFPDDPRLMMFVEGVSIGIFAPKQRQSNYIYDRVRFRAGKQVIAEEIYADPDINIHLAVSRGDEVAWTNGSFVRSQTASEQSNVEGGTYNLIIIDEAQLLSRSKVQKEILPMLAATNGTCVKIGTAHVFRGGFHDTILHNIEKEKKKGIRNHFEFPYDIVISQKREMYEKTANPFHLNYEAWVYTELERLGGNTDNEEFKMNFRLLWQQLNLGAVDREAFYAGAEDRLESGQIRQFRRQVAGLDFARMHDSTVLTILEVGDPVEYNLPNLRRGGDEAVVYHEKTIVSWYETTGRWSDQINGIVEFLSYYAIDVLCVDATGVGDPLAEALSDMLPSVHVEPIRFSVVSKDKLFKLYLQEISAGRLLYAAGEETRKSPQFKSFIHQHESLEKEWTGQYLSCHAPEGDHDDYCDSAALACWATTVEADTLMMEVESTDNPFYAKRGGWSTDRPQTSRADRYRR